MQIYFNAFIIRFIKELPGDRMVTITEEGESMHSVCFFMSYKTSWFMEKIVAAQLSKHIQRISF